MSAWPSRANGLRSRYNKPGFDLFDYNIYAVCGDGCMMEGVGSEAASLAGHLALDDLCWIYDNNHITIDGKTKITFTEDVAARFLAYHWNVLRVGDANDLKSIEEALAVFRKTKGRPTLIILDSHIGYGSPHKVDTSAAHGEPLGEDEVKLVKRAYHWPENAKFLVPDGVMEHFAEGIGQRGGKARHDWEAMFAKYRERFPDLATEIDQMQRRELPAGWDRNLPSFPPDPKGIAGRDASSQVLNVLAQNIPWFLGGSADLASSNKTALKFDGAGEFEPGTPEGRNMHFGIREHAMAAIVNGLSLSKLRAFGSTFFIFSDYARPAIRLSALMELPTIFVFTHDAMGDGEDGPTHQPVEQLISLRAIPGLVVLRPADANEVVEAYRYIMQLRHQPAVLALSRQALPTFDRRKYASADGRVARCLCHGRPSRWLSRDHPHRFRERGRLGRSGPRNADGSGNSIPRCLDAVLGHFRAATAVVSGRGIAAQREGARRRRAGVGAGLGPLCWSRRSRHRHEDLRRLSAAQGIAGQVRFRARAGRRGCYGGTGTRLSPQARDQ